MIYTGYYANMKKAPPNHGYTFYSISRGNPAWFSFPLFDLEILKPSWDLVEMAKRHDYEKYLEEYKKQLDMVNVREILGQLKDESILLCYEAPDKFCHRHIVRNWLDENGILCREITFKDGGKSIMTPMAPK